MEKSREVGGWVEGKEEARLGYKTHTNAFSVNPELLFRSMAFPR